ncbi:hypothetical protein FB384_004869 [Prauserella sediminis]|uniref:Uncharacterized protein n=1 Tax=Prauserella sediminis TaxID=577680 RepID=A0A839XRU7_9PSEU|nr:hypothetical protein [Prauserella sediminis]MBB3665910.1 hypothetical protein [Prauserella sediminis]
MTSGTHRLVTLKSRLLSPDGTPVVGEQVTATLMSRPSWIVSPSRGRAIGSVTVHSDVNGYWRMSLLPHTEFEIGESGPYVWYQVTEGDTVTWSVRFDDSDTEVWLKDRLIDTPRPDPQWTAIDTLATLHDVAREVADAPDGSVLVKRDGVWTAEPLNGGGAS